MSRGAGSLRIRTDPASDHAGSNIPSSGIPFVRRKGRFLSLLLLSLVLVVPAPAADASLNRGKMDTISVFHQTSAALVSEDASRPAGLVSNGGDSEQPPDQVSDSTQSVLPSILVILGFILVTFVGLVLILRAGLRSSENDDI